MSDKLIMDYGAIKQLPELIVELGSKRPFIITDKGIVQAGIFASISILLSGQQIAFDYFDQVESDPSIDNAREAFFAADAFRADLIIGLGGGSAIDIAKMTSVMITNGYKVENFVGINNITTPGISTIMIPTTAGTGSEVTPIAVLSDKVENLKKGVVSDFLYPTVALIDPELAISLPAPITAYTGIDALTHAIEAYTNKFAQPFIDTFALKAIALIAENLETAVHNGTNKEARYNMALGSLYGGMCLGAVNTAAVHALAYPLGGMFNIPHGIANSLILPYVIEFNLTSSLDRYADIANAMGVDTSSLTPFEAATSCIDCVQTLCKKVGIEQHMRNLNIPEGAIEEMAKGALQVTRLLNNNPRVVTLEDARNIYQKAY